MRAPFLAFVLAGCAAGGLETSGCPDHRAESLVRLLNEIREQEDLPRLWPDRRLALAAQRHAQDLAVGVAHGHEGSGGSTVGDRIDEAGVQAPRFGETVASGYRSPEGVVGGWMESPPHRSVILDARFRAVGVGIASGGSELHWVADFASPGGDPVSRGRCHPVAGVR